jgi:hypothetical protein
MSIHINEALPVLDTILKQQQDISDKLNALIQTFKREPEPVELVLRSMLQPLNEHLDEMKQALLPNSETSAKLSSE